MREQSQIEKMENIRIGHNRIGVIGPRLLVNVSFPEKEHEWTKTSNFKIWVWHDMTWYARLVRLSTWRFVWWIIFLFFVPHIPYNGKIKEQLARCSCRDEQAVVAEIFRVPFFPPTFFGCRNAEKRVQHGVFFELKKYNPMSTVTKELLTKVAVFWVVRYVCFLRCFVCHFPFQKRSCSTWRAGRVVERVVLLEIVLGYDVMSKYQCAGSTFFVEMLHKWPYVLVSNGWTEIFHAGKIRGKNRFLCLFFLLFF